jgi:hypothetical protein
MLQKQGSRLVARAVLRLLLRSDSRTPILLLEDMYYASGADTAAAAHITEQAQCISNTLGVPYCTKDSVLERCANSEHSVPLDRYDMLSQLQCLLVICAHSGCDCDTVMYARAFDTVH